MLIFNKKLAYFHTIAHSIILLHEKKITLKHTQAHSIKKNFNFKLDKFSDDTKNARFSNPSPSAAWWLRAAANGGEPETVGA